MEIRLIQTPQEGTNCYILCDEKKKLCAIIDPGGIPDRIAGDVESNGYTPCAIMLTHGHYDHTNGVAALQEKWPEVPVYLNQRDVYMDDPKMQRLFPVVYNTKNYDEGDTIQVGDLEVTVLATPGHSEGSVVLRCGEILFCGDTLFAGSMGRTDFAGGSTKKIMNSFKRLANLEGNFAVLPGHMGTSDLESERKTNPYMHHALRF